MVRSLCLWAAGSLPVLVGLWRLHGVPSFRDDPGMLRVLGLLPVGFEGGITTYLSQLFVLLPLGTQSLRVALLGVLALGACGVLLFRLTECLFLDRLPKAYAPLLALFGSSLFTLHPGALVGGLQVGGPMLALALALALAQVLVSCRGALSDERGVVVGALLGSLIAESPALGLLCALLSLPYLLRPAGDRLWRPLAALSVVLLMATLPLWLRPLAPGGGPNLAIADSPHPVDWKGSESWQVVASVFGYAAARLGVIACALGVVGWCASVVRFVVGRLRQTTELAAGRLLWLSALLVGGASWGGRHQEGSLTEAPHALALAGLSMWALFAAQGLAALLSAAIRARLPLQRGAFALSLAFAFTLVLRGPDRLSSKVLSGDGTLAWTEEALGRLPPSSLLLVSGRQQAHRLLAAQRVEGIRPDVLIVPADRMQGSSLTTDLVEREPELAPLLRQLAVHGVADEYSLCRLADARPLFVQLDPDWDPKLIDHLRPDGLWLGFSPHALGRTDRNEGLRRAERAFERMLRLPTQEQLDEATRGALAQAAEEQVLVLAAVGDREGVQGALAVLEQLDPSSPVLRDLPPKLEESRGRIAIADLARAGSSHLNPLR